MNFDDSWINEYELNEKDFEKFYTQPVSSIEVVFLYINKENELEKIKKKKHVLETKNKLSREKLIKIIKENIVDHKIKYSLLSILQHNITLNPNELGSYLTNEEIDMNEHSENVFFNLVSEIDDIYFEDSISFFRSLDSIFVIFYESTKKLRKNSTKKIYLSNSTHRKTKKKPLKYR